MEPQLVPMAPQMNIDMRRILFANLLSAEMGELRNDL